MLGEEIPLAILRRAPILEANFSDEIISANSAFMFIMLDVRPTGRVPNKFV